MKLNTRAAALAIALKIGADADDIEMQIMEVFDDTGDHVSRIVSFFLLCESELEFERCKTIINDLLNLSV